MPVRKSLLFLMVRIEKSNQKNENGSDIHKPIIHTPDIHTPDNSYT